MFSMMKTFDIWFRMLMSEDCAVTLKSTGEKRMSDMKEDGSYICTKQI